ncbi:MAG: PEP-utilizing enzyme [Patescibacteria group bacterium]
MGDPKDYQKLFQIELRYLASDLFAQHYKTLRCLLICDNGLWTSYIPKEVVQNTMKDGVAMFSSEENFNRFEGDFRIYIMESKATFEEILGSNLTEENAKRFLCTVADLWKFYSKTEFFYTDGIATVKPNDVINKNLKTFEQIKNDGRLVLNSLIFEDRNYLSRFLNTISEKFNTPLTDLNFYSLNEIADLFLDKKVQPKSIVKRKEFFFMQGDGEAITYGEGKELRKNFVNFLTITEAKEIKGTIANKGIVTGKVKVFPPSYYSDFSMLTKLFAEMEDGDVLVAETTSPELMPACKKAGAILANQGGLLSHAAIVSRELNIPCIVGLGNAVQALGDGDMVEVDADNGIVKILKKHE